MKKDNDIWVGSFSNTGSIIVYDPSMQIQGQKNIYAYSVARGVMRQFDPEDIRQKVTTLAHETRFQEIALYELWKEQHGSAFLASEPLRLSDEAGRIDAANVRKAKEDEKNAAEIIRRHNEYLEDNGLPIPERRVLAPSTPRMTHCWNCKKPLSNLISVECESCKWIICSCGACGCGKPW